MASNTIRHMAERAKRAKNHGHTEKRNVIKIGVSPTTNDAINRWLDRNRGWGKSAFLEMLVEWFGKSPDSLQHIVARTVPADMKAEYKQRAIDWIVAEIEASDTPLAAENPEESPSSLKITPPESGKGTRLREGKRAAKDHDSGPMGDK